MAFVSAPTGHTEMPLDIKRAKQIKEKMGKKEVMGLVTLNDNASFANLFNDSDDDDEQR